MATQTRNVFGTVEKRAPGERKVQEGAWQRKA